MKYIDADRLRAEIEIKKKTEGWCEVGKDTADIYYARGVRFTCDFVLNLIDSLQQKLSEVDLEKEVEKYLLDNANFVTKSTSKEMVNTLARHFYELGRNQVLQELYKGKIKPFDKIAAAWLDDE